MSDTRISVDTAAFERGLKGFEKQLPFALSKCVNMTTKDAVAALRGGLSDEFTVRNSRTAKGITFNAATKTHLQAEVGSRDAWMVLQALGGTKHASKKSMAVPVPKPTGGTGLRGASNRGLLLQNKWPSALGPGEAHDQRQQKRVAAGKVAKASRFFVKDGKGGTKVMYQRMSGGHLKLVYQMKDEAPIKARWPLEEAVREVVEKRWAHHALAAMKEAIDTAK